MRRSRWLLPLLIVAACSDDTDRSRQRELAMIEMARADSADEADFITDSTTLASTITVDSIVELRIRDVTTTLEDGDEVTGPRHEAVNRFGLVCGLDAERYVQLVKGDTLRCQWGPAQ